jgi:hypothetical protein
VNVDRKPQEQPLDFGGPDRRVGPLELGNAVLPQILHEMAPRLA